MDYARIRDTALRLLEGAQQGQVVLSRHIPGAPDPAAPWAPVAGTEQTEALMAVVRGDAAKFADGVTILASDRVVICAPPAMGIRPSDGVNIDGKAVQVLAVTPIPGAGDPAVFRIIVRG